MEKIDRLIAEEFGDDRALSSMLTGLPSSTRPADSSASYGAISSSGPGGAGGGPGSGLGAAGAPSGTKKSRLREKDAGATGTKRTQKEPSGVEAGQEATGGDEKAEKAQEGKLLDIDLDLDLDKESSKRFDDLLGIGPSPSHTAPLCIHPGPPSFHIPLSWAFHFSLVIIQSFRYQFLTAPPKMYYYLLCPAEIFRRGSRSTRGRAYDECWSKVQKAPFRGLRRQSFQKFAEAI